MYDTLVLPGGGSKGFVLLGALQALYDSKKLENISIYIGTSVGSIICYLLAIGYTPIEIVVSMYTNKWMEKMQFLNLVAMINGNGATSFTPLYETLEKLTILKIGKLLTLEKLKKDYGKTLVCTTYNMTTCRAEYLNPEDNPDLPCLTALRMSANIPLVFDRFMYMDSFYIDGGISDNFPLKKAEEIGTKIIGVYIDIDEQGLKDNPEDGVLSYILRLLQIPILQFTKYQNNLANSSKSTIYQLKTARIQHGMEFNPNSRHRLEMFSTGYSIIKEKLTFS